MRKLGSAPVPAPELNRKRLEEALHFEQHDVRQMGVRNQSSRATLISMSRNVGLIGFGAIGRTVAQAWNTSSVHGHRLAAVLVRSSRLQEAKSELGSGVLVTHDADEFLAQGLGVVIEMAGQHAVADLGSQILRTGVNLMILSVGSLADNELMENLRSSATAGRSRLLLPSGAIAGIDGLLALRQAGLRRVVYSSTKPPSAWKGTLAESLVSLDEITVPTLIFQGTAREAATRFPKNANVAATVAFAGLGLDHTEVILTADPRIAVNMGMVIAEGDHSQIEIKITNRSTSEHARTSLITGLSALAALDNDARTVCFV
jgi:aspartate dehydrogenase